jgi:hypothetical protein
VIGSRRCSGSFTDRIEQTKVGWFYVLSAFYVFDCPDEEWWISVDASCKGGDGDDNDGLLARCRVGLSEEVRGLLEVTVEMIGVCLAKDPSLYWSRTGGGRQARGRIPPKDSVDQKGCT